MPLDVTQKALIVGGSRGIGREIALTLADAGVGTFFINYVENTAAADDIAMILREKGAEVHLLRYNMGFPNEIAAMFDAISNATETLDYFVHCAALTTFKPLCKVKSNQWDLTMNISAKSFLMCTQACVPLMQKGGSIVAISSTGSQRYNPNYGALGVSKATLESIVRYLAVELAPKIRINSVVGGLIKHENLPPFPDIEMMLEETLRRTPAQRIGTPKDIADTVLFLLTKADFIFGQNIIVDGGFCLT